MADVEILESKSSQQQHQHQHQHQHQLHLLLHSQNLHLSSQIILRAFVISSTLAATWIILTAKQSVFIFGIPLDARYNYSPAFKYFAWANAIASAFSFLISIFFIFISSRKFPLRNQTNYIFFLHDFLMMGFVLSGCAAATAIGYVGKYGNIHAGWLPICDHFSNFCNRVTTSVALSYFAVLCLLILTIISAIPIKSTTNNAQ